MITYCKKVTVYSRFRLVPELSRASPTMRNVFACVLSFKDVHNSFDPAVSANSADSADSAILRSADEVAACTVSEVSL